MGLTRRVAPKNLPQKLLQIRQSLGLSQNAMLQRLGMKGSFRSSISGYERGEREPPLPILLSYAEVANICLDVLVDDKRDLPEIIPAKKKRH